MILHGKNMSKTLTPLLSPEPLQLAFLHAGAYNKFRDGVTHRKAIPYTIVAQACEGAYEVKCGGRRELVKKGGVFVVPVHTPVEIIHWAGRRGIMSARWLHIRFSLWGMVDFLSLYDIPLQLPPVVSLRLGRIIERVLELQNAVHGGTEAIISRNELAMRALRLICGASTRRAGNSLTHWNRLHPVLRHIQENLSGEINIGTLSLVVNLSPAQFHALFKEEFGIAPMKYVRNMRLDLASRQLATKDWTLSEIADSTGFKDPFHFSHAFKAQFGISPREYRRQAATALHSEGI